MVSGARSWNAGHEGPTPSPVGPVAAIDALAGALDRVADALVAIDATALLEEEPRLGRAVAAVAGLHEIADRAAAHAAAARVRASLLRCRRLGASMSTIVRALTPGAYDKAGGFVSQAASAALRVRG